jgi:hypothetical protein
VVWVIASWADFPHPDQSGLPPPAHGCGSTGILKFLDLMFFNLDLTTSGGLSTIRFIPSDSRLFLLPHRQPLRRSALSRRSMQPTRQIWTPCVLTPPVIFHLRCFLIRLCFLFFLFCNFFSWVLVSVGDPFTGYFVLIFVVPILFHIQISARPSLLKGLFWTGLKASAWVMPLFTTDLVFNPLYADQALALFKVDRVGTFLVLLELKTHYSLIDYHVTSTFDITILDLDLLLGSPPLYFYICNPLNSYLQTKQNKKKKLTYAIIAPTVVRCVVAITS